MAKVFFKFSLKTRTVEHSGDFNWFAVPSVVGIPRLRNVGAEIVWKTSMNALIDQSKSFENRALFNRQPV